MPTGRGAAHKPFDATLKELVERYPRPWLSLLLDQPVEDVQVINADLATIVAESDKLFRVGGPRPFIVHTEFVASFKADLPLRGLRYGVLARYRHRLPVQTIFVLLRPQADGDSLTGVFEDKLPDGTKYLQFRYNVVKVWELPAADLLAGDLATVPLAAISRVSEQELPGVIRDIDERIEREASPGEAADLRLATSFLLGLTHTHEALRTLLQGVGRMRESAMYDLILEEGQEKGQVKEAKKILLHQGRKRFGEPEPSIQARLEAIEQLDRIESLLDRQFEVSSWDELMAEA